MSNNRTKPGKVYMATFGCQMNDYDTARMMEILSGQGWTPTDDPAKADFIFLNTCSIREKAEQKVYSMLGRLRPFKEANPDLVIGVGGCVAQQLGEEFLFKAPFIDIVLGTHAVNRLPEFLDEVMETRQPVCYTNFDYDLSRPESPSADIAPRGDIRSFLTIMQGCDNFCAYCVVPYVRGREISRRPEDILDEARSFLDRGVKEITLLGQNVNSYGRGLEPSLGFADLVERVAALDGLLRLRFTTSHPKDLSPELIRALAEIKPLCKHIHLPVQSGSNRILTAMRRRYTREDYLRKVEALRKACPDITLTTDIIVGFPSETEEDFQDTMDLVGQVRYDNMFSFKYSDRPLTLAQRMPDKIDDVIKSERLAVLQSFQKDITLKFNRDLVGSRVEVLVEGPGRRYKGQLTGRTGSNKVVNFPGPESLKGALVRPLITRAWANSLLGKLDEHSNINPTEGYK